MGRKSLRLNVCDMFSAIFLLAQFALWANGNDLTGEFCSDTSLCPFAECADFGSDGHLCICRVGVVNADCDISPMSLSPYENGTKVPSPSYDWEVLPDIRFSSNLSTASNVPHKARLFGEGWVGNVDPLEYVQVDLVVACNVKMIATQGKFVQVMYIGPREFYVAFGTDENAMTTYRNSSGDIVYFPAPISQNLGIVFTKFETEFTAQFVRVYITAFETYKLLMMELYGDRTLDECSDPLWNSCHSTAQCIDTPTAYECKCPIGANDVNNNGFICVLVDECTETSPVFKHNCSQYATCADTPAAFTCTCLTGYEGDGYHCEDIDECKPDVLPLDPGCHEYAFCNNTVGSYECNCKPGFSGDGIDCMDVNECKKGIHKCHKNAICNNQIGTYICTCRKGYKGNGYMCTNIDECKESPCSSDGYCLDTEASFRCRCNKGFNGNGFRCTDVNECSNYPGICGVGEQCINLPGNYTCMCPGVMPLQFGYSNTTYNVRKLFDSVIDDFKDDTTDNYRFSFDYHAHKVRTIMKILRLTYDFHSKEVRESFFINRVVGNCFAIELYDFRSTDVANFSFPNLCHPGYSKTQFQWFTDIINIWLTDNVILPFDLWATAPPYALGRAGTTPTTETLRPTTISYEIINGTNVTITEAPATTPGVFTDCGGSIFGDIQANKFGYVYSPVRNGSMNYPSKARCLWRIEVPEPYNVYVRFFNDFFELEHNRKCEYDYVEIMNEKMKVLKKYCGNQHTNHLVPVRSTNIIYVRFYSDINIEYKGFKFEWHILYPRASLACIVYNQVCSVPSHYEEAWRDSFAEDDEKSFVPVSKLMACYQDPISPLRKPGPIMYTFEHFREDRNDKKCIHWYLDSIGTSFNENICKKVKTNKTHTVCECTSWGVVGVLGRAVVFREKIITNLFELGLNCFFSSLMVTLSLIAATLYLFLKDQWGAAVLYVFTRKEFDSGRMLQLHIMVSTLFAEIFFMAINFGVTGQQNSCYILAFLFYYALQTVFFWLFIYTVFLQSRVSEVFDTEKYNSYKIYLFVGYVVPLVVTFTVTGLGFKQEIDETMCWFLFEGTNVWGFSGVIITLGLGTLILLADVTYDAHQMSDGLILQERCIKTGFTTFFVLLTSIFGVLALKTKFFIWQYLFSICNLLQGFSIVIMYCILKREDPIIKANQVGPKAELDQEEKDLVEDEETVEFLDVSPDISDVEEEAPEPETPVKLHDKSFVIVVESDDENQEAAVDEPIVSESESDDDQEIMFREDYTDDYNVN